MKDIAKELGVSVVTVSKALSEKEGVSDTVREEIKNLAHQMGYKHNTIAKAMKEGKTYNIGVIVSERFMKGDTSFYWEMYQAIIKAVAQFEYTAILEVVSIKNEIACIEPQLLSNNKVDGLIMLGQIKGKYIDFIKNQDIPILFLDFYDKHFDMDAVVVDNMYSSYYITNYLIERGHQSIGFVGDIHATSSILDRYLGFYKALLENNLHLNEEWVIKDRNEEKLYASFELPKELPTAFVCNCDEVAYYFIQDLEKKGFSVPKDVSIVAFDNYIYSKLSRPQITTVQVEVEEMALEAARGLIHKIKDNQYRVGRKVIEGKLIARESVRKITRH